MVIRDYPLLPDKLLDASWPLFALSHHVYVWQAAEQCDLLEGRKFVNYAILGDDLVIADERVYIETL